MLKVLSKKLVSCEVGPNYELDDALIALKNIFWPRVDLDFELKVKSWFQNFFNLSKNHPIWFLDNGRSCLYTILKNLNLPKNSEVLIQPFSCVVLPNAVWQTGYKPILIDVDPANFNFDLIDFEHKISSNSKVVIIQYTFGQFPNLKKFLEICKKHDLIIIEDCAHSLGINVEIEGKKFKLGSLGHFSFFSFGRDKIVSTTRGGAFFINPEPYYKLPKTDFQKNFNNLIEKEVKNLKPLPFISRFQMLLYVILTFFIIRPFYRYYLGKIVLFASRSLNIIGEIYTPAEKVGTHIPNKIYSFDPIFFELLFNQLKKFEKFSNHRQQLVNFYYQKLSTKINQDPKFIDQPLLRFPLDLKLLDPNFSKKNLFKKIQAKLKTKGVMMGQWYTSFFLQDNFDNQKFNLNPNDLRNTKNLVNLRIINLPTNIHTSNDDAQLILDEILKFKN